MGFNMLDPVVGGDTERARKLRQAISIAVDYEEFISIFLNGRGIAARGRFRPASSATRRRGRHQPLRLRLGRRRAASASPIEDARACWPRRAIPNGRDAATGEPLVLYFDTTGTGPDDKARLDWLRKQFEKLDVQLVVRATDYNRFQDKMRKGNAQMFFWGWNADYPDPENFLFLLYGPQSKVKHQGENAANYANPEFDRLFERMKDMDNGPERQAIIDRMVEIAAPRRALGLGLPPKDVRRCTTPGCQNVKPNRWPTTR